MNIIFIFLVSISFIMSSHAMNVEDAPNSQKKQKKVGFTMPEAQSKITEFVELTLSEAQKKVKDYNKDAKTYLRLAQKTQDADAKKEKLELAQLCYCQIILIYLAFFKDNPQKNSKDLKKACKTMGNVNQIESLRTNNTSNLPKQIKVLFTQSELSKAQNSYKLIQENKHV